MDRAGVLSLPRTAAWPRRVAAGVVAVTLLLGGCSRSSGGGQDLGLHQVADISLPGGTSRFDYQSLDLQAHRLYIAHLGAGEVVVVDTQAQAVVGTVRDVSQVHGVLAVPQLGRVYATATGANEVAAIDAASLQVVARAPGGEYPDGLAYDPDHDKLYISDESGGTDTVIDAQRTERTQTIPLGGEVGNTQYDPVAHRIYAAVQTRNQVIAIDPGTDQVVGRYDMPGCEHPHGLAIAAGARRAVVACEQNARLVMLDLDSLQVVATETVGDGPDVLAFDEGLHRLYVAAESGVLAIFQEHQGTLTKLAQGKVAANAHSVAIDSQTHHIYLPLENVDGRPVLRILEPAGGTGTSPQGRSP